MYASKTPIYFIDPDGMMTRESTTPRGFIPAQVFKPVTTVPKITSTTVTTSTTKGGFLRWLGKAGSKVLGVVSAVLTPMPDAGCNGCLPKPITGTYPQPSTNPDIAPKTTSEPDQQQPPKHHYVYEDATPNIYQNTVNAIAEGKSNVLTYGGVGYNAMTGNRDAALSAIHGTRPTGMSYDEYPYASTVQGGAGSRVQLVPVREQNVQGGQLRGLYSTMKPGESFIVVPVPKAVQPNLIK